jgi:hypothetical protein
MMNAVIEQTKERVEVHSQRLHESLLDGVGDRGSRPSIRGRPQTGLVGEHATLHTGQKM